MLFPTCQPELGWRSHPRFSVRRPVSYSSSGKRVFAATVNLGLGGLKLESLQQLPKEWPDIDLDLWPYSIRAKTRMVYSQHPSEGLYVEGLQFLELTEENDRRLQNFLTSLEEHPKQEKAFGQDGTDDRALSKTRQTKGERELSEDVQDSLRERIAELETAYKELETFCHTVSHDLHNPLLIIEGLSRRLSEIYSNHLDAKGQQHLNTIRATAQRMGRLIEDLFAFSKTESQGLEPIDIDMNELTKGVIEEMRFLDPGRAFLFNIHNLPSVSGDQSMIRQVLVNLLANAMKFTRRREIPVIEVGAHFGKREHIYYVKDNGIGFEMEYANRLFNIFYRLHDAEEFEGTGAGLAIVKRIIQRHGGQVWASGSAGVGATFYFSLPAEMEE